jgi:hypothetical protein
MLTDGVEGPEPDADPLERFDVAPAADAVRQRRRDIERVRALLAVSEHANGAAGWLPAPLVADPGGDELRAVARARVAAATGSAADVEAALEPVVAETALRLRRATDETAGLERELVAVREAHELPLPRAAWQRPDPPDGALFASMVDFVPGLDEGVRAGLEAAGLLTATVRPDGGVVADTGELLLVPGAPVTPNLASVLVPALERWSFAMARRPSGRPGSGQGCRWIWCPFPS